MTIDSKPTTVHVNGLNAQGDRFVQLLLESGSEHALTQTSQYAHLTMSDGAEVRIAAYGGGIVDRTVSGDTTRPLLFGTSRDGHSVRVGDAILSSTNASDEQPRSHWAAKAVVVDVTIAGVVV